MPLSKRLYLAFLCLAFLWLAGFAIFSFGALNADKGTEALTADAIIVLTGGADRVEEGLSLFAAGKANHLFISGVHPDVKKHEIEALWTGEAQLPRCCITIGRKATTTIENAAESTKWVRENGIQSIFLVTSNYHMARAKLELRDSMPGLEIYPYPVAQSNLTRQEKRLWALFFSEYHKFLLRRLQLIF